MNRISVMSRLREFEGCVPHMYRCTGGEVTIGVGHAIFTPLAALQLTWNIAGVAAGGAQVETDYTRIAAAKPGMVAAAYAGLTSCRMDHSAIAALLADDTTVFEQKISAALPGWSTYPEPAQEALFDMAYNLGVAGLKKFTRLLAAAAAGQWSIAARECERRGIGEDRNRQTAALFLQCGA